jgi:dienelactone hydrolase
MAFRAESRDAWQAWRRKLSRKLKSLTGYDTMLETNPRARITEEVDLGDLVRQRLEIFTEPHVLLTAYVLIPKDAEPPFPVVITPHGHGSGGKFSVAGRRDIPEVAEAIEKYNYDYGVQFAREGFITISPDARGFGERREEASKSNLLEGSCQWINQMAYPLGQTVTGMWTWDLHRLVDYATTREDCLSNRIGCAGLSGGGLQTLWASALDPRICCAVISGYMYGYKESLLDQHTNCSCNYVPHLYEHVDMGDIAALIAPRPLLVETGTRDSLNGAAGLKNVRSQMRTIRKAYQLLDAKQKLSHDIFEGEHLWHGVKAIPWMKRHLGRKN